MLKRRNLLLAVLIGLCGVWVHDNWTGIVRWVERQRQVDHSKLSVRQLATGKSWAGYAELRRRAWEGGPQAVAMALDSGSSTARYNVVAFLNCPERAEADARILAQWRDRLLRLLERDEHPKVRNIAAVALARLIHEEFLADVPRPLIPALRMMLARDEHARAMACIAMMFLGERAEQLRPYVLAVDVSSRESEEGLGTLVCSVLGSLGPPDAATTSYLLDIIDHPRAVARVGAIAALGDARVEDPDALEKLFELAGEEKGLREVRRAAIDALGQLKLRADSARRVLPVAVAAADLYESYEKPAWVSTVAAVAVQGDASVRAAARSALVRASRDEDLRWRDEYVAAAVARLAVADQDRQALLEVMPAIVDGLAGCDEELQRGSWRIFPERQRRFFEALAEICEWQEDAILGRQVAEVLERAAATQAQDVRSWCRPLLARLRR